MQQHLVLLGAGASVQAKIPMAREMSKAIFDRFQSDPALEDLVRPLSFALGGLIFQRSMDGGNPFSGPDVEDLFNAVLLLADRHSLEVAPFVSGWHSNLDQLDQEVPGIESPARLTAAVYGAVSRLLQRALRSGTHRSNHSRAQEIRAAVRELVLESKPSPLGLFTLSNEKDPTEKLINAFLEVLDERLDEDPALGYTRSPWHSALDLLTSWPYAPRRSEAPEYDLQRELENAVAGLQPRSGKGGVFRKVSEQMIRSLIDLVWIREEDRVRYLEPLLRFAGQDGVNLVIAGLNYDNAVELASANAGVALSTGITRWAHSGRIEFDEGVRYLKLHGSVDWEIAPAKPSAKHPLPHVQIEQVEPERVQRGGYKPAVIFGHRNKLTAEGPFLQLLRSFQDELERTQVVTVVGYSFRDSHVNEYLTRWINKDEARVLRVVDPYLLTSTVPYAQTLVRIYKEQPQRIELISEGAATALARLFPD